MPVPEESPAASGADRAGGRSGPLPALAPLLLAVVTAAMAIEAWSFPAPSRYYPGLLSTALTILLVVVAWRNRGPTTQPPDASSPMLWSGRVLGFIGIWVLYPLVMLSLGFLFATLAAMIASLLLLRIRRPTAWSLAMVPGSVAIFAMLQVVLNIALPATPIERAIARFLYGLGG